MAMMATPGLSGRRSVWSWEPPSGKIPRHRPMFNASITWRNACEEDATVKGEEPSDSAVARLQARPHKVSQHLGEDRGLVHASEAIEGAQRIFPRREIRHLRHRRLGKENLFVAHDVFHFELLWKAPRADLQQPCRRDEDLLGPILAVEARADVHAACGRRNRSFGLPCLQAPPRT